jgi:3-methyladenine DNA glycosylase AlkD
LGSDKPTACIGSGETTKLAKKFCRENNFTANEFLSLLDSLYSQAATFDEIELAARLISAATNFKKDIPPAKLDYWLGFTHGWAEVDLLCQSNFLPEDLEKKWQDWQKILIKFSKDKNIHKRRASLVLLTKSLRNSPDKKFLKLALTNTDRLKKEKEILITKAISWVLRSAIKNHKKEVVDYLEKNKEALPKIAIREVTTKLITGRKTNR